MSGPSASEVTTLWRCRNLFIVVTRPGVSRFALGRGFVLQKSRVCRRGHGCRLKSGAGCLDNYLRMISSRSATAVNGPLAHPPLPESSCRVRLRGGDKCRVPPLHVKLVNIVYRYIDCGRALKNVPGGTDVLG